MGSVAVPHQGEEGAEEGDGAEVSDVGMHVVVLLLGEQRVVALDAAALHVLVPAGLDVRLHQGSLTLARCVEFYLLHLVLHTENTSVTFSFSFNELFLLLRDTFNHKMPAYMPKSY